MGLFGGISRALGKADDGGLSIADRLGIFSSLYGGDVQGANAIRNAPLERAKRAQQQAFLADLQGRLSPQYAESAPVQIDESGLNTPGAQAPDPTAGFQLPQRTSDGLNINSPELGGISLQAAQLGANISPLLDVLKAQQPDVAVGPDGTTYNKKSMAGLPQRFATPQNINGWNIDQGDPKNRGAYFPKLPDGVIPDGRGGVVNTTGLTGAMGAQEEAQTLGRTRGTMMNVPIGGGRTRLATGAQYLDQGQGGGFGVTQSPDDAAYAGDLAKASAAQYTGIQAAGQKAGTNITNFARMQSLLDGLNTGRLTPAGLEFQKALASVGVQGNPAWGRVEAADALSKKLALDAMGGSLGAGFSNADRSFVEAMNPSIMNTPQGRAQMIAFGVARAKREQEIAQKARQWQQRAGRLDKPDRNGKTFFDYLDAYAEANPLMAAPK